MRPARSVSTEPTLSDPAPLSAAADAGTRLGQILLALGRLHEPQIAEVLARQAKDPRRFGELALILGYVTQSDVDLALRQQQYGSAGRDMLIDFPHAADLALDDVSSEVLVAVRSQLVHRWFGSDPEQRALAFVSPQRGDGRSYVCSRLARLFADLDEDTLLIDADLRNPSQHKTFGIDNSAGLSDYLAGQLREAPVRPVPGMPCLHVLPAGQTADQPHLLIARNEFWKLLEKLTRQFSAILIDTPATCSGPDAMTVALRASGALLVVRKHRARVSDVRDLAQQLTQSTVEVLGAVINEVPE